MYTWHWEQIPQYFPLIGAATLRTLQISVVSIVLGSLLGALAGLMRVQPVRPIRFLAAAYVELLRNIPLMLVLYLIYFGLGAFFPVSPFCNNSMTRLSKTAKGSWLYAYIAPISDPPETQESTET